MGNHCMKYHACERCGQNYCPRCEVCHCNNKPIINTTMEITSKDVFHLYKGAYFMACYENEIHHQNSQIFEVSTLSINEVDDGAQHKLILKPLTENCFTNEEAKIITPLLYEETTSNDEVFLSGGKLFFYLIKQCYDVYGLIRKGEAVAAESLGLYNPYK